MHVKASLAKLELRDVKDGLIDDYEKLRDLRDENADEWAAVKGGFLSSWDALKDKFHSATRK